MAKRSVRTPGRRGRPWTKDKANGSLIGYRDYEADRIEARETLKRAVERDRDAAALVQLIRDYQEAKEPLPSWIPVALESFLGSFVALSRRRKPDAWALWARRWLDRFIDRVRSQHFVGNRDVYGLTREEAADEAACWLQGTHAAGSPATILASHQRAEKSQLTPRPFTYWEERLAGGAELTIRPFRRDDPRIDWWGANRDRLGHAQGEWKERPRLMWGRRRQKNR